MRTIRDLKNNVKYLQEMVEDYMIYRADVRRKVLSALEGSLFFTIENVDEDSELYSIRSEGFEYYIGWTANLDRTAEVDVTMIYKGEPVEVLTRKYNSENFRELYMDVVEAIC